MKVRSCYTQLLIFFFVRTNFNFTGTGSIIIPSEARLAVVRAKRGLSPCSDNKYIYGDVYYAHCAAAYSQGGGASSASIVNKFQPLSFDLAFDNKRSKYICSGHGCC